MTERYVSPTLAVICLFGLLPVFSAYAQTKPSTPSIVISPASVIPQDTKATITVKATPADPKDVLVYQLWTTNGTFSEFGPLYAQSTCSYFPPPFAAGPGLVHIFSEGWNTCNDVDGVFTFTADAPPGKYEIGCGAIVSSGPNQKGHSSSVFVLTVTPAIDTPEDAMVKIEDPRFDFDIVIAKDAIPSEVYAAREFRTFFAEATGIRLPIVTKTNRPDRHIFIGPSEALRQSNVAFSVNDMGDEDLRIIVRDNNIAIAGDRPRGTLYGVYTFLEDYLGVRFLTNDHTHVPKLTNWPLAGPIDTSYSPPLEFRWSYYAETNRNYAFAARLRCNTVPRHLSNNI